MSFCSTSPVLRDSAVPQENGATHSASANTPGTNSTLRESVLIIGNGNAAEVPNSQRTTSSRTQARETDGGITLAGGPFDAASQEPGPLPPEYGSIPRHQGEYSE